MTTTGVFWSKCWQILTQPDDSTKELKVFQCLIIWIYSFFCHFLLFSVPIIFIVFDNLAKQMKPLIGRLINISNGRRCIEALKSSFCLWIDQKPCCAHSAQTPQKLLTKYRKVFKNKPEEVMRNVFKQNCIKFNKSAEIPKKYKLENFFLSRENESGLVNWNKT